MDMYLIDGKKVTGVEQATQRFNQYFDSSEDLKTAKLFMLQSSINKKGSISMLYAGNIYSSLKDSETCNSTEELGDIVSSVDILKYLSELGFMKKIRKFNIPDYEILPLGRAVILESTKEDFDDLCSKMFDNDEISKDELFRIISQNS